MEVMVSFRPRPLYPRGKNPWYPLDTRVGGPLSRCGRGGEEKNPSIYSDRNMVVQSTAITL